jgi:hypothetical protein
VCESLRGRSLKRLTDLSIQSLFSSSADAAAAQREKAEAYVLHIASNIPMLIEQRQRQLQDVPRQASGSVASSAELGQIEIRRW